MQRVCSETAKTEVPNYSYRASELKMILGIYLHELTILFYLLCYVAIGRERMYGYPGESKTINKMVGMVPTLSSLKVPGDRVSRQKLKQLFS